MSNVVLSIGGRQFTIACADGEEEHVAGLGRMIDSKVGDMAGQTNQNEGRMLLFAALLLADELHDARSKLSAPADPAPSLAPKLEDLATRLENLASRLEG